MKFRIDWMEEARSLNRVCTICHEPIPKSNAHNWILRGKLCADCCDREEKIRLRFRMEKKRKAWLLDD